MNSIKRTCATCAAFNPSATDNEEVCGNLVYFTEHHGTPQAMHREPGPDDTCDSHQTHEEDAAETSEIEAARQVAESTPDFLAAKSACSRLVKTLSMAHPDRALVMPSKMSFSLPSLNACMANTAKKQSLIIEADGYTEDGAPVFSLELVAATLGMGMDKVMQALDAVMEEQVELGLPVGLIDPSKVHRKH